MNTSPAPLKPFRALVPSPERFSPREILLRMESYYTTFRRRTTPQGWGTGLLQFLEEAETLGAEEATRRWLQQGWLVADSTPHFYLHEHTFQVFDQTYTRRGLLALYRLGMDLLYPHEDTFAEGIQFHLHLLETTRKQFAPVMAIYPADAYRLQDFTLREPPVFEGEDEFGQHHRYWRARPPNHWVRTVSLSEMVLADGHHRAEAAVRYAERHGFPYLLVELIPYGDPGLLVLPTHRVVYGVDFEALKRRCRGCFEILRLAPDQVSSQALLLREFRQALVLVLPHGTFLLRPLPELEAHLAHLPAEFRRLPVYVLHDFLLQELHPRRTEYVREVQAVYQRVQEGGADAGFLLPALAPETVARLAWSGLKLPHKSTDFYPKLVAGPVILHLAPAMVG